MSKAVVCRRYFMMQFREDIRIRQNQRKPKIHWARVWFWLIGVMIILLAVVLTVFYISLSPVRQAEQKVNAFVLHKTKITKISSTSIDNRKHITYAVIGEDASKQKQVAIVNGSINHVRVYRRDSGLSDDALRQLIIKKYQPKKIYSANISRYQNALVWEVSYLNQRRQLNYVTLDFKTGKPYRTIEGI